MSANKVRSNQILCLLQLCTESLLSTYTVEINSKKFRVDRDKSDFFQVSDHCEDHKHHPYILSTVYIYDYFISSHSIILWLSVSSKYKKKNYKKARDYRISFIIQNDTERTVLQCCDGSCCKGGGMGGVGGGGGGGGGGGLTVLVCNDEDDDDVPLSQNIFLLRTLGLILQS